MGRRSRDIPTKISFKEVKTHRVVFNPDQETETQDGERGEYEVMPVLLPGKLPGTGTPAILGYSSQRLIKAINALELTAPHILEITQSGAGMETNYQVRDLGLFQPQQPLKK